eukprot:TRINITY_DN19629_c0_g1_i1.p1 TRINITY_DN19629_c0_g1~~TRINITY_DN19629_c0_g1_i1.p1  ORF type:complete len:322 (-),score=96.66 TRINITY_DN19629_c0_g1_i1:87-1052(-)
MFVTIQACSLSFVRAFAMPRRNLHTKSQVLRRVLFNVPGSDQRKIKKATTLDLDCVVLDLEDGVAINQKTAARQGVVDAVQHGEFGRAERLIRMNAIGSGLEQQDIADCLKAAVATGRLGGVVVPKVESAAHLDYVGKFLDSCETGGERIKLIAAIESARGLLNLRSICEAQPNRLETIVFASEDFVADTGMTRTPAAVELLFARSAIVTHAVAYGLQPVDMVCLDYKDNATLTAETADGARMGFTGKQAIHPNQIEPIYRAFRPADKVVDLARRIIDGNEAAQRAGKGAFELDGRMIDMPMVKWARNILLQVDAAPPPSQ